MKVDKGSVLGHVTNCRFNDLLDHKPELVVNSLRLSFLLRDQRGVLLYPCPLFPPICFYHRPRLLDLVLDAHELMKYILFHLFQNIQSIDDVLGWYFVMRSSRMVASVV